MFVVIGFPHQGSLQLLLECKLHLSLISVTDKISHSSPHDQQFKKRTGLFTGFAGLTKTHSGGFCFTSNGPGKESGSLFTDQLSFSKEYFSKMPW